MEDSMKVSGSGVSENGASGNGAGAKRRRGRCRQAIAVAVAVCVAAIVPAIGAPSPAAAAVEIGWYLATPGYVRTNLQPTHVVRGAESDSFFAVLDGDSVSWTLLKISLVDGFTVLAEVEVSSDSPITDIEVSAAGALFVLSGSTVTSYSADDLSLIRRVDLEYGSDEGTLSVAQDRTDRFALTDLPTFDHRIYTGGELSTLSGLGLENIGLVGFGVDSDRVLAVDTGVGFSRGRIALFDISAEPTLIRIEDFDPVISGNRPVEFGVEIHPTASGYFFFDTTASSSAISTVDAATLAVRYEDVAGWSDGLSSGGSWVLDVESGQAFAASRTLTGRVDLFDPEAETLKWVWPTQSRTDTRPIAALGDGLIAVFERGGFENYLSIGVSDILGSGYGEYHAVAPSRLVDTRVAVGVDEAVRLGPGQVVTVQVAGRGGVPDEGVLAVTMNATVTQPTSAGYVTLWPSGEAPVVSNVNYVANQTVANSLTVTLSPDGTLQMSNSDAAAAHVILDVTGYYSNAEGERGARYFPGTSRRLLDTRPIDGMPSRRLGPGDFIDVEIPVAPGGSFESGVEGEWSLVAGVLNVTAVGATAQSHLTVYPSDLAVRPTASTLNFAPGDLRSNSVVATVSGDNTVRIYNEAGSVDIVVDYFGGYSEFEKLDSENDPAVSQAGRYYPTRPFRRFDSRESSPFPGTGALTPGSVLILGNSEGWTDIWNVTATQPTAAGFLTVTGWAESSPSDFDIAISENPTSNVNFVANETVATAAYATGTPDNGIYNGNGSTHVIIDVFGYLTPRLLTPIEEVFTQSASGGLAAELRNDSGVLFLAD